MPYQSLLFLLLFCAFSNLHASLATELVTLKTTQQRYNLTNDLQILEDPSRALNISEVTSKHHSQLFQANVKGVSNFGYIDANLWLRFDLKVQSTDTWFLLIDQPVSGDIELFIHLKGSEKPSQSTALYQFLENHRTPAWKLNLLHDQTYSIYLRANNGHAIYKLPLKLMTSQTFIDHSNSKYLFFTAIFSGLWVLALYNLFLAFILRDLSHITLVAFIIAIQLLFYHDGNLFPALTSINNAHAWFHPLGVITLLITGPYYWQVSINQNINQLFEKALKSAQVGGVIAIPFILLIPSMSQTLYIVISFLTPLFMAMIAYTAIKGHRITKSAAAAGLTVLVSGLIYIQPYSGLLLQLPSSLNYISMIGVLIGILLLSIVQADQNRVLREQTERANAITKATNNFLTTMSHELRTPMHAIVGVGELLKSTYPTPKQEGYILNMEAASSHMLSLIDDILDLARMVEYDEKDAIHVDVFDLEILLKNLENLFSVPASQKKLEFIVHSTNQGNITLEGAEKQLKQVLVNLLGNAIKFTNTGTVKLQVTVHRHAESHLLDINFEVVDTGIGISFEQQASLFKPFYKADSSHSRQRGGSGLGLAISHQLVAQLGSELKVESLLGEGSRFFFTLRLAEVKTSSQITLESNSVSLKPLQGICILLADDDELNQQIGRKLLTLRGAEVVLANDGKEVLEQVENYQPDLVLMDISMPDMDGYEATSHLRTKGAYAELPIIALTAHAITGERERCISAGMNDYLTKPFSSYELVKMVLKHAAH